MSRENWSVGGCIEMAGRIWYPFGISRAAIMSIRLILLIISTSILLTLTTTPLKMSDALAIVN